MKRTPPPGKAESKKMKDESETTQPFQLSAFSSQLSLPPPPPGEGAPQGFVPVRGASGRLYGMLDPTTLVMEFKAGKQIERIDLRVYERERAKD